MERKKTAIVSGYFDPLHVGHIEYFKLAKEMADELIVIVNNHEQCMLKKGDEFLIDCCTQHISSIYGRKSKEIKDFRRAVKKK